MKFQLTTQLKKPRHWNEKKNHCRKKVTKFGEKFWFNSPTKLETQNDKKLSQEIEDLIFIEMFLHARVTKKFRTRKKAIVDLPHDRVSRRSQSHAAPMHRRCTLQWKHCVNLQLEWYIDFCKWKIHIYRATIIPFFWPL